MSKAIFPRSSADGWLRDGADPRHRMSTGSGVMKQPRSHSRIGFQNHTRHVLDVKIGYASRRWCRSSSACWILSDCPRNPKAHARGYRSRSHTRRGTGVCALLARRASLRRRVSRSSRNPRVTHRRDATRRRCGSASPCVLLPLYGARKVVERRFSCSGALLPDRIDFARVGAGVAMIGEMSNGPPLDRTVRTSVWHASSLRWAAERSVQPHHLGSLPKVWGCTEKGAGGAALAARLGVSYGAIFSSTGEEHATIPAIAKRYFDEFAPRVDQQTSALHHRARRRMCADRRASGRAGRWLSRAESVTRAWSEARLAVAT